MTRARLTEIFHYLDGLRESGITNMYGAGAYVEGAWGLDRKRASAVVGEWMRTFDRETLPEARAKRVRCRSL